jgi:DNA-binding response OmpR family regulator
MTKPFTPRELVARIRAHLRRATEYSQSPENLSRIVIGSLTVDLDRRDAFRDGQPAQLTEREFELLHLLARNRDRALAADWIFENIWGYESETGAKTLAVFVRRLRCKIEKDPDRPAYLITVRGYGYKLADTGAA